MREDFEYWFFDGMPDKASERNADGEYRYMPAAHAWNVWQAAANEEREACAKICDRFAARDMHPAECAGAIRMRSN